MHYLINYCYMFYKLHCTFASLFVFSWVHLGDCFVFAYILTLQISQLTKFCSSNFQALECISKLLDLHCPWPRCL